MKKDKSLLKNVFAKDQPTTTMTDIIKQAAGCPFCGADPELGTCDVERGGDLGNGTSVHVPWSTSRTWHTIKCSQCDCILDNGYKDEASAIAEWNKRQP